MSSKVKISLALLMIASSLVGCSTTQVPTVEIVNQDKEIDTDQTSNQKIEYSNLVDTPTQEEIKDQLIKVGVSNENVETFFKWVEDYNERAGNVKAFKNGFIISESPQVDYEDVSIDFRYLDDGRMKMEVNCRLTAFLLFKDFVDIGQYKEEADNYLMFDMEAINNDPSYEMDEILKNKFVTLFDPINVEEGTDIKKHIKQIQEEWQKRGITFKEEKEISLITLFMHDPFENKRFVGHTGVLLETGEGLIFIEKYSFEKPFQCTKFKTEEEVISYILSRNDIYGDKTEADPIVMRNDKVIS